MLTIPLGWSSSDAKRWGLDAFGEYLKVVGDRGDDAEKNARIKPVRWQYGKSLSMIFQLTGTAPSNEVYATLLKNCCEDGDYEIEFVCAEALGNAKLTIEQRREVEKKRRIMRETYRAEDP